MIASCFKSLQEYIGKILKIKMKKMYFGLVLVSHTVSLTLEINLDFGGFNFL